MANNVQRSALQEWTDELNSVGRIEFRFKGPNIQWWYLILAFGFIGFMIWAGYMGGRFTGLQASLSTIVVLGSILLLVLWPRIKYSGRSIIVELDNIRLMDGTRFYWNEIEQVRVNSSSKSGPTIVMDVTKPAWERYIRNTGFWSGLNHRLIKLVERKPALYMAAYIEINLGEFIGWLDSLAQGREEESEGEQQLWQTQE